MATKKSTTLPDALDSVTPTEALTHLRDLHDTYRLIPNRELDTTLDAIAHDTERLGYTAHTLITEIGPVLQTLTGGSPNVFRSEADTQAMHQHRNLVLVLALAAASSYGASFTGILAAKTKVNGSRTRTTGRPMTDDEILLLRMTVLLTSRDKPAAPEVIAYTLTDAGQCPAETSLLTAEDLDDLTAPTEVYTDNNDQLAARLLPLDTFNRLLLSRATDTLVRSSKPLDGYLIYTPRGTIHDPVALKTSATVSAHRRFANLLTDTGLAHTDVTGAGIRSWRVQTALDTDGIDAALDIAGLPCTATGITRLEKLLSTPPKNTENDELLDAGVSFL